MHKKKILIIFVSLIAITAIASVTLVSLSSTPTAQTNKANDLIDQAMDNIDHNRLDQAKDDATKALAIYTKLKNKWQIINTESILKTIEINSKESATGNFLDPSTTIGEQGTVDNTIIKPTK